MKVLCKKDLKQEVRVSVSGTKNREINFLKNKLYEVKGVTINTIGITDENGEFFVFYKFDKTINEILYTPEETTNILRTKLIDKMLCE